MHHRFSIITPALNAERTIARAINSVDRQCWSSVQHIVVDGASSDSTTDIVREYKNVELISEPDLGLSDAVNKGLARATGDLIGWLNADDWYLPGAFHAIDDLALNLPFSEWFTGRCRIVNARGSEIRRGVTAYKNALLSHYSFPLYLTQNFISCPSTFVRKNAFDAIGNFRLDYHYSMDYDMFLRLARRGDPAVTQDYIAAFVMEEGTKSMTGFERQFREHREQAREHGSGHPIPVAVNYAASAAIITAYRTLRLLRRW